MLAIRMQRTGRKGYAQFRIVVQDTRQTPTSGRVVASIGTYNPHTKEVTIDAEKAEVYLKNGAQPSDRVAVLLKKEGLRLPSWVELPKKEKKSTKHIDKLRKNRPVGEPAPAKQEASAEPVETEIAAESKPEDEQAQAMAQTGTEPTTETLASDEVPDTIQKQVAEPTNEEPTETPEQEK